MNRVLHRECAWRTLPFAVGPAAPQLAAGAALLAGLAQTSRPALRWYGASAPALILGAGQKLAEIDLAACRAAGVAVYRRSSGGTAVWFAPELLMLDVALPAEHPLHLNDVTESYAWFGAVWVAALAALGLEATALGVAAARADTQALDPLLRRACFGGRSPYEVLAGGRKLVGFAQVRRRAGAVFQAGVYRRWAPQRLTSLLALDAPARAELTGRLAARVVGLDDLLPAPLAPESLMHAFATALADLYGARLEADDWLAAERADADAALARYAPLA